MGIEQIIAVGTFVSSVLVAIIGVVVSVRKSRTEAASTAHAMTQAMWSELCKAQQASIDQLTRRIEGLQTELDQVRAETAAQRHENDILRGRVRDLETQIEQLKRERAQLKAQLERGE